MNADPARDPPELFAPVYAAPTAQLIDQRGDLLAELEGRGDDQHA
jgi:2-oxoisovalerate dehydrogenase E1 component alpha subunit